MTGLAIARRLRPLLLGPLLLGALLLASVPLAAPAFADHLFILPSRTLYSGEGNMVTFDAAGADHVFFFDHRPLGLETIHVWKPDGAALSSRTIPSTDITGHYLIFCPPAHLNPLAPLRSMGKSPLNRTDT